MLRAVDLATWTAQVSPGELPTPDTPFLTDQSLLEDLVVAEVDGAAVGYARLSQTAPMPSHRHVLSVNGLAVAPSHQRLGLGRALLGEAVSRARQRGACKVTLRVLGPNLGAQALYASCGFEVEGVLRREFLLDGELVDDLLMALHLPS